MKLWDVAIRFRERYLSVSEIDEINSYIHANIRDKKVTLFSLTIASLVRAKDEISKLDQLCGKSCSFKRTDGPIKDPQRLDRTGPFCGVVERSVLSVLSIFGHASMMSTGMREPRSDGRLNSAPPSRSLHLSSSYHISSVYRCTVSLITNCLRELPLATARFFIKGNAILRDLWRQRRSLTSIVSAKSFLNREASCTSGFSKFCSLLEG